MNYLKFTQYAYLLAGILFLIDAFSKYQEGETNSAILSALLGGVGVFMFFFRRSFAKKFEDRNKKK